MVTLDIPHRGSYFGEYSSVKPDVPSSQELEQALVFLSEVKDAQPLLRDKQHMNPDKVMEDPACGWRLGGFTFLVEKCGSMGLEYLSLSRLNHELPRTEDKPGMMEGTAEVPHPIADAHFPEAAAVFDAATALDTAMDRVDPQPTLVELLVRHVLLPCELLPQTEINSTVMGQREQARAELSTAIEMYQAMEMIFWLPETETALAQVDAQ